MSQGGARQIAFVLCLFMPLPFLIPDADTFLSMNWSSEKVMWEIGRGRRGGGGCSIENRDDDDDDEEERRDVSFTFKEIHACGVSALL